jgi:N-acyl-D-aspartate/D-glutamate deacylase
MRLSIAPLGPDDDADYMMRMLARVEGMPVEALQVGVPWDWSSTDDYLARLDGRLMLNAGFMVGQSALRRRVMHQDATKREVTDTEIAEMAALLRTGLSAGVTGGERR